MGEGNVDMKFVTFVDKDKFELFALAAHVAGDVVVMKFGPQKISCNRICEDGGCLFSGEYIHAKTSIQEDTVIPVALSTCELITYLAQLPSGELSFGLDAVNDFVMEAGGFRISMTTVKPCPPSDEVSFEDYPLWFYVDTELIGNLIDSLDKESVVVSREEDGLYFTNPDWSMSIKILPEYLVYEKNAEGIISTMVDYQVFRRIFDVMSIYKSVKIILGDDMPLIFMGNDEQVRLAFMIAPQVEEEEVT
jgi:hypothetical protein